MSAALPYLHNLRKTELSEFAEKTNLPEYESMKKADLEVALDEHLRANQSSYAADKSLSDYYKRLGTRSPVKKETVTSGDEAPAKKQRRKTKAGEEIASATNAASSAVEPITSKVSSTFKTPSRQSLSRVAASVPLPASPAAVTDMMERQTTRLRQQATKLYNKSGISEGVDQTRTYLSSAYAVQVLFLAVEAYSLFSVIMPFEKFFAIPPIKPIFPNEFAVHLPNVFAALNSGFWTALSLWASTSIVIPAIFAYFFNIAHGATARPGAATRRSSAGPQQIVDPLVFSITKFILVALVYFYHFQLFGAISHYNAAIVRESMVGYSSRGEGALTRESGLLGGVTVMLTGAAVTAILSMYEAILKK